MVDTRGMVVGKTTMSGGITPYTQRKMMIAMIAILQFVTGIVLILIARSYFKTSFKTRQTLNYSQRYNKVAEDHNKLQIERLDKLQTLLEQYTEMRRNVVEEIKLNRQVTEDAIAREERAKAALVAVLRTSGCDEAQIEDVLKKVEEPEKP